MSGVVIYGTGSPILVDVEASLERAGATIAFGVRNQPVPCFLSNPDLARRPEELAASMLTLPFIAPMFTPANRQYAAEEARSRGFTVPFSLIDPSVAAPRRIAYQPGFYVNVGCSIGAASTFDAFVFINRGASIGHHCRCGAFASIGPGAVLSGGASVGKGSFIGAGAIVVPGVTIGDNVVVGAGAVVREDVPDHTMVAGNPANTIASDIPGYGGKAVT